MALGVEGGHPHLAIAATRLRQTDQPTKKIVIGMHIVCRLKILRLNCSESVKQDSDGRQKTMGHYQWRKSWTTIRSTLRASEPRDRVNQLGEMAVDSFFFSSDTSLAQQLASKPTGAKPITSCHLCRLHACYQVWPWVLAQCRGVPDYYLPRSKGEARTY